jgi:hypothetical protein
MNKTLGFICVDSCFSTSFISQSFTQQVWSSQLKYNAQELSYQIIYSKVQIKKYSLFTDTTSNSEYTALNG